MVVFLACWLLVSVVGGVLIGKAIHRADVVELQRSRDGRRTDEHAPACVVLITAAAPESTPTLAHAPARAA